MPKPKKKSSGKKPLLDALNRLNDAVTQATANTAAGEPAPTAPANPAAAKSTPQYAPGQNPGQLFGIVKGALPKDSAPYSYANIYRAIAEKDWSHAKGERLVHEDLVAAGFALPQNGGILVPLDPYAIEQTSPGLKGLVAKMALGAAAYEAAAKKGAKALSAFGDDTTGGALVMPQMANSIIELMRPQVVVERAGAQTITLPPSGQLVMARQTTDPSFTWIGGENKTIADSEPNLGNLILSAKRAAGLVVMSNDSLRYTNPSIEVIVRNSLAARGAIFEDKAFLEGAGSSFEPRGIINHTGITPHTANTVGANGNTFSFEDPAVMISKVFAANDPTGPTAFIMRPELFAALSNRRADSVTAGDGKGASLFWLTMGDLAKGLPDRLRNVPVLQSTQISNTRVKGTGTTLTYTLLGNFRHALIARYGVMEMAMDQSGNYFANDQTAIRCIMRVDFALTQEKPFVFCDQLLIG
ncbi:phage major capsid protein [Tuwongella immobilis]|uniref:Phage capsid-like C-terminal domain-containing protein n=1 Tax=Tuwongella immobilis TaxID=692036 RepID=A0A6C2YSM9_9BACT|nr:phage major capsid protein [Tuwongella immobilis]VIP03965.1 Uncharacterized protein OS=Ruegeria sp. (strain TM1040) GN=TM1040_1622 PE=4 SV=1: Phage_capsid [Tuwongella immobilis]VTS05297.1 Uncharacterized protein OS=Ruegeria sp. (strain TM1040) GN=TM1040_1622 PE=4 SV=1: Phage_capsid [Tuwongella immobilis]